MILLCMAMNVDARSLVKLDDKQMSEETGQALFNLSYIAPTDSANLMSGKTIDGKSVGNIGFYKLGMEADIEINTNIKTLQLGCGGVNGAGGCDIEINNLALSGLPNSYNATSSTAPDYSTGTSRPVTSAKLENPFLEFAIKNPDSASTREVIGFRTSAEKITGLLTLGIENGLVPSTDGLQTLSGFMRLAATNGSINTKETLFGNTADQVVGDYYGDGRHNMTALANNRLFTSQPGNADNLGISIPAMKNIAFNMPESKVNGIRNTAATVSDISLNIKRIPMGKVTDANGNFTTIGAQNQLYVTFPAILIIANKAKFVMDPTSPAPNLDDGTSGLTGSDVRNLNLSVTFKQNLSMVHNIPLTGNGGYLALQGQKILWPGSYIDSFDNSQTELNNLSKSDVAQAGWWLSFANPVQLGTLTSTQDVDISSALPQVAKLVSQSLQDNPVQVPAGAAIGSLFNTPISKLLNIDLKQYTTANPVKVSLQNLQLANQTVTPNCWGNLKFC